MKEREICAVATTSRFVSERSQLIDDLAPRSAAARSQARSRSTSFRSLRLSGSTARTPKHVRCIRAGSGNGIVTATSSPVRSSPFASPTTDPGAMEQSLGPDPKHPLRRRCDRCCHRAATSLWGSIRHARSSLRSVVQSPRLRPAVWSAWQ